MALTNRVGLNLIFIFCTMLGLILLTPHHAYAKSSSASVHESTEYSHPEQSVESYPINRLNSGFVNLISSPAEIPYQTAQHIHRSNIVRGLIPGIYNGIKMAGVRIAAGVFEIATFALPLDPMLEPLNTDWMRF